MIFMSTWRTNIYTHTHLYGYTCVCVYIYILSFNISLKKTISLRRQLTSTSPKNFFSVAYLQSRNIATDFLLCSRLKHITHQNRITLSKLNLSNQKKGCLWRYRIYITKGDGDLSLIDIFHWEAKMIPLFTYSLFTLWLSLLSLPPKKFLQCFQ